MSDQKNLYIPDPPPGFIPRKEIQEIITIIESFNDSPYPIIYIHGIGGIGKTTIVQAICDHFKKSERFLSEGAIWITLKDITDDELNEIIIEKSQTFFKEIRIREHSTLETTTQFFINDVIGKKNMILVFDDLWKPYHFDVLYSQTNRNLLRLCTSHSDEYLHNYEHVKKIHIQKMQPADSFKLLSRNLTVPDIYKGDLEKLAERAVDYPTALALINGYMRDFHPNEPFEYIFEQTVKRLDENGLSAFDETDSEEGRRNKVVRAAIETNLKHLSSIGRGMYERLTIFSNPDIIETTLAIRFFESLFKLPAVEIKKQIYAMEKLSLIRQIGGVISFNDVIYEYMRTKLDKNIEYHGEFLKELKADDWQSWTNNELYLWENVIYHYVKANNLEAAVLLVLNIRFVAKKISFTKTHTVENDLLLLLGYCDESKKLLISTILKRFSNCNHLLNSCGKNEQQLITALKTRVFYDYDQLFLPPHFEAFVTLPDVPSKELIRTFFGHDGRIYGCHINQNGRTIVTASEDSKAILWNVENGFEIRRLEGHRNRVFCAKIAEDNRHVVTGGADHEIRIWDIKLDKSKVVKGHQGSIWACDVSRDLKTIISASEDKTVKVWDFASGNQLDSLDGHNAPVTGCRLFNNGEYIISSGHDNKVIIWKKDEGVSKYRKTQILEGHSAAVWSCSVSQNGRVISSSIDCEVRLWNMFEANDQGLLGKHKGPVWGCDISEDGKFGFSVSEDMEIKVWDLDKRVELITLIGHSRYIWGVSYCSEKQLLLSCSLDNSAKLWDLSMLKK